MPFSSPYWLPTFCDHLSIPASVSFFSLVLYSALVSRYVRRHLTLILSQLLFWISCAFCYYYYVMFPLCLMVCGAASNSIPLISASWFGGVSRFLTYNGRLSREFIITSFVSYLNSIFNSIFNSIHLFTFSITNHKPSTGGHIAHTQRAFAAWWGSLCHCFYEDF